MIKKIYFVDSWSVGFKIVKPVIEALNKKEVDLFFVHFDSLIEKFPDKLFTDNIARSNKLLKKSKLISGLDLEKYKYSVVDFIKNEKPDLLIFISIHNLEQRYFLNIAKEFKLKTMLIMHGVILKEGIIGNKSIFRKLLYPYTKFNRLRYYTELFKIYNRDLEKVKGDKIKFNLFLYLKILVFKEKYVNGIDKSESFRLNSICMTVESDEDFYTNYYNQDIKNTKYKLVGHLDNYKLINYFKNNNNQLVNISDNCIIFFSQPHVKDSTISEITFYNTLKSIKKICDDLNVPFILRPHPRDDRDLILKIEKELKIEISSKDLEEDLFRSKIIIGINSTVLLTANQLEKNIIIIDFGFANQFTAISPEKNNNVKIVKFNNYQNLENTITLFNTKYNPLIIDSLAIKNPVELIEKEIDILLND